MVNALELIRLHFQLECKEILAGNLVRRIPCADPDDIHRVYIAKYAGDYALYFREDVVPEMRIQIRRQPPERIFTDYDYIAGLLGGSDDIFIGKSYIFPPMDAALYPDASSLGK